MRNITKSHKGNYLKHLLIVTSVAVPILLIFIFLFVVPFGTEFKSLKREAKLLERDLKTVELKHKHREKELYSLEVEHKQTMSKFKKPKNIDEFLNENPYIDKIIALKNKTEDRQFFTKYVYKVETKSLYSTLENVYDLMKNSKDFNMKFVIGFPITFEVAKKGRLRSSFYINIEKLKPIKKEIVRPYKDIQK